jgi:hypothetical protein
MRAQLKSVIILLIILFICLFNPPVAWSAEISKVKDSQVLIVDFEGNVGSEFYAIDGNGKKKAVIHIDKAKGGRAIGKITKGKAAVGYTLIARTGGGSSGGKGKKTGKPGAVAIGAIFGYSMDSMSVPVLSNTISLSGSGFSIKGAADITFSESIAVRLLAGYETFSAKNASWSTEISYVTLDALGRYLLMPQSTFSLWLGAGMGFAIPFSKSTNVLQEDSIATSTLLYVATGFDLKAGKTMYFPVQVDYAMFLPASDVKTTIIAVRGGVMMTF